MDEQEERNVWGVFSFIRLFLQINSSNKHFWTIREIFGASCPRAVISNKYINIIIQVSEKREPNRGEPAETT